MNAAPPPICEVSTMAAFAAWPEGEPPKVTIALSAAAPLSFRERLPLTVTVSTVGGTITTSQFLSVSRGIALDVRDAEGRRVCSAEPSPWSPPPPPPGDATNVVVTPTTPYRFNLNEPGKWVFPGPGAYIVRAVLVLWGPGPGRTANYTTVSEPLTVDVRP